MANALDKEGKTADAGQLFTQFKTTYPWSPKVVEANFGIAKSLVQQKKLDDASKLLVGIVGSRTAPSEPARTRLFAYRRYPVREGQYRRRYRSYLKTAAYYGGVPDAAAEGLWKGAQMLEKQAAGADGAEHPEEVRPDREGGLLYKDIVSNIRTASIVPQAQDRLRALGSPVMTRQVRAEALIEAFGSIYPEAHCELIFRRRSSFWWPRFSPRNARTSGSTW